MVAFGDILPGILLFKSLHKSQKPYNNLLNKKMDFGF